MNQLFKTLENNQVPNPFGNMQNMISQFNQFKQSFTGNPQQQVEQLLQSGRMTQEQFENLKRIAQQFQRMMK